MGKHKRVWKLLGKATRCDSSLCNGKSKTFGWANISGDYSEDVSDWKQLCMSCHKKYDLNRPMTDKDRVKILLNGLARIGDEISFLKERALK